MGKLKGLNIINQWAKKNKGFPCCFQYDRMDCGPAVLATVAEFYGKKYTIQELREYCSMSKDGVSLLGIEDAANQIGFETLSVMTSLEKLKVQKPTPCILHWNGNHYVVLYNIKKISSSCSLYYIADPTFGKIKLKEDEFISHWLNTGNKGIALLLFPKDDFYIKNPLCRPNRFAANLLTLVSKFKKEYYILIVGLLVNSIFSIALPFLTQTLIDIGIETKDINAVSIFLLAQITLFAGITIVSVIRNWTLLYCNSRINIDIISSFLSKIIKQPFKFFETKQLGDFSSRIADYTRIQDFLTSNSITLVFSFFNFIIYFFLLSYYDLWIVFVYSIVTFASVIWTIYFVKKEKQIDYRKFGLQCNAQQEIFEIVNGISEIKLNNTEDYKLGRWKERQLKLFGVEFELLRLSQLENVGFTSSNKLKDILIVFIASYDVIIGEMTMGSLMAVSYIIGALNDPISKIIEFARSLQQARLSYDRLTEVQSFANEDSGNVIEISPEIFSGSIKIEHLCFQYLGHRSPKVLDDLNFSIPFGKTTAIVGESGSGKTTLIKILLKFYDTYLGNINIGETDLKQISAKSLRNNCGVVMQDGYIFSDTLERNIATGNSDIDHQRLQKAIQIAELEDFVQHLPQGLHTPLGSGGNGISGGQKQRILIARAVYKCPAIIILDEATSSLDAQTENRVYHNLEQFLHGKTVIKIAHRLSTVKSADQIIVLSKGKIIETGVHQKLIAEKGAYYNLVKNQLELSV